MGLQLFKFRIYTSIMDSDVYVIILQYNIRNDKTYFDQQISTYCFWGGFEEKET